MSSTSATVEVPGSLMIPGMASVATKVFEPLVTALSDQGIIGFEPLNLASINPVTTPEPNGLEADIAVIRTRLTEEIEDKGRDVFLLLHSYGGNPGLASTAGLWKSTREKQGKKGGILKAICISAAIVLPGQSSQVVIGEYLQQGGTFDLPMPDIEETPQGLLVKPTGCRDIFFDDLPASAADHWDLTLVSTALSSLSSLSPATTTNNKPTEWDIAYLQPRQDKGLAPGFARYIVSKARDAGARIDEIAEIDGGHFPWLARPEETAGWVADVVRKAVVI